MLNNILFVVIGFAILTLLHWYVWRDLVRAPRWNKLSSRIATIIVFLLGLSVPFSMAILRLKIPLGRLGVWIGAISFSWLGLLFYLIVTCIFWDLTRLAHALLRRVRREPVRNAAENLQYIAGKEKAPSQNGSTITRRVFLARTAAISSLSVSTGLGSWGIFSALDEINTPEIPIRLSRLPQALSGFRIALLADLHIGLLLGREFVDLVVDKTNLLKPDLIVIVGDLVDGTVKRISSDLTGLSKLRSRYGVYFVTGNHEYYADVEEWIDWINRLGIPVLMNQRVSIGDRTPAGASFDLIGVPDYRSGSFTAIGPDMHRAAEKRDPSRELVVLAHQPIQVYQAEEIEAGLQLSGHTHGGQLFPFGALTRLFQPYLSGLHQHSPTTQIYVSRGVGYWGPPMRVLAPAEITSIILHT